jgi:hypothetical protein
MNSITIYLVCDVLGGFRDLGARFVGGNMKLFLDTHVAQGLGDLTISVAGLLLIFWFMRFLYRRKIFLRL